MRFFSEDNRFLRTLPGASRGGGIWMTTLGFGGVLIGFFFFFFAARTSKTTKLRWGFGFRKPFLDGGGFGSMTEGRNTKGACRRAGKSPPRDAAGLTGAPHGFAGGLCGGRLCGGGLCGGLGGRLDTTSKLRKSTGAWRWPCQGAGGATYTGLGGGGGGFGGRLSPRGGRAGGARMPRRQFWSLSAVDIAAAYIAFAGVRRRLSQGEHLASAQRVSRY